MPREMPRKVISKKDPFKVQDMLVTEFIRKPHEDKPAVFNLTWVRYPFEEEMIDGMENRFVHTDFGKPLLMDEEYARKCVREAFLNYWRKIELWVPPGT